MVLLGCYLGRFALTVLDYGDVIGVRWSVWTRREHLEGHLQSTSGASNRLRGTNRSDETYRHSWVFLLGNLRARNCS